LDRLTALPLIQALLEFDLDDKAYSAYDAMTARELFRRAGVSAKLYHEFLEPILLVTLFAPGEQLSGQRQQLWGHCTIMSWRIRQILMYAGVRGQWLS